jgi:hypothetical protein
MSLFSIDFQQRFHIKPSTLLRHGRSERTGDGPTQSDQGESPIAADSP